MWKRDEAVKPTSGQAAPTGPAVQSAPASSASVSQPEPRSGGRDIVNIGKSVVIKGELNGSEDLTIEGQVEGKIELKDHVLTIGPNGKIKAQVFTKALIVLGEVNGNVTATEKVEIRDGGSVDGDIVAPRVAIADGAHFRGSVDMQRRPTQPGAQPAAAPQRPAAAAAAPQAQAPAAQVAQPAAR
ncbi:MAG: polymer-forming cytoskeletal protein [Acidobacteria bacterium]|nr:polymer-forming cytoskeletal protein [Acidobacteriota bacterium]